MSMAVPEVALMRACLVLSVLFAASICLAAQPDWAPAPDVYAVTADSVEASDGGGSTGDHYLLTREDYADFALSFDITRLAAGGDKLRSLVVWHVDEANRANREAVFLPAEAIPVGETQRVEVVKLGTQCAVKLDGRTVASSAVVYGTPPARGRLGLLHYYNYHFRYTNWEFTPLDADHLPRPANLRATVSDSGAVELAWEMPDALDGLLEYEVVRRQAGGERERTVARARDSRARDLTARTGVSYAYAVAAVSLGRTGPMSEEVRVTVDRSQPPKPVMDLRAVRRIDGSARLSWDLPVDSRCAGLRVEADGNVLAERLSPDTRGWVAPAPVRDRYVLITLDPDRRNDARTEAAPERTAPAVRGVDAMPVRHPFLRYSAEDVDRVRRLAESDETVRATVKSVCSAADSLIANPLPIPRERTDDHAEIPGKMARAANAYMLSGDDKYAAWVRQALLDYADFYPTMAPHGGGRARIFATASGLYEAMWYVTTICAYDQVYDSPVFSTEDHARIEERLLRPAAELFIVRDYSDAQDYRTRDLHYKCYNFQAWFISAVGLTGLLLGDADMVEYAIDGPYGYKHLLKHDVHDDGIFWERSLGYHSFVLIALLPFLEASWHCDLDLWNLEVPDDYNEDILPLENYCVGDGDNGPKSLRLMLDAPFYAIYGNRTYANVADSNAGPLQANAYYRVAWKRLRDPKVAWLYWQGRAKTPAVLHRGADDLSGTVRMAYDDEFLYIAADVRDDIVRNTRTQASEAWAGDALWVGLKWWEGAGGPYDFIYGLSPGEPGRTPPLPALFNRFSKDHNGPSAGDLKVVKTDHGYALEMAIPLAEFAPREGETGTALEPADGKTITVDFVLYDGDPETGASTKEKMLSWSCTTDRYDSAQGGTLVFGAAPEDGQHAVNAPRAQGIAIDGDLSDWARLNARAAIIGPGSAVMTDAGSGPDLTDLFDGIPDESAAAFDLLGESFANNGKLSAGCSLFPSTGFAVLRERLGQDGLPPVDATCCTLNFGPHGGGHGHSDRLSIVLYADGKQWVPDFGSCGYSSSEKGTWTAQTISHNMVVVDEVSHYPTGAGTPTWPCDSATKQSRGVLEQFQCDGVMKAAQARCTSAYEGITLRRTTVLVGDGLVDFYEVQAAEEHQYDYPLHIAGAFEAASVELADHEGVLAQKPGYQHIDQVRRGTADGAIETTWRDGARRLRVSCGPAARTELIVCRGITTALDQTMPMMVLRRHAQATVFATVMQPFTESAPDAPEWLATGPGVIAVRVPTQEGKALVVHNATGGAVEVEGLRVPGRLAARLTRPDGTTQTSALP